MCTGLGTAASNIHRDIYKSARSALTDRAMPVRAAAAECLLVRQILYYFYYITVLLINHYTDQKIYRDSECLISS